ncbi:MULTISPECIES: SDR family oxidoreductase [unclassified Microbacterium]|uniref:SDR family oxidoreductase n=1 Tax=unclassified Microbacterium TaxID=2609290 RepID=UPI00214CFBCA|nr:MULTISPECIES: SDR family oxidoreductase [unclassified Microbacterium]MCR2811394.1 SDR family oxidoreductase [Microbacterium sp. zg.B185]WIM19560.1 SDR family oxidoreductase [Microbacterium sp. zg-B185]
MPDSAHHRRVRPPRLREHPQRPLTHLRRILPVHRVPSLLEERNESQADSLQGGCRHHRRGCRAGRANRVRFDRGSAINLRGAIKAAQAVEPIMREQRSGVVLNVSSMSAIETSTKLVTYRTGKAALIVTQQFAVGNAEYGIRANAILRGRMDTAMAVDSRARMSGRAREEILQDRAPYVPLSPHTGTGWDIGDTATFLASDETGFITRVSLPVDGGALVKIGW